MSFYAVAFVCALPMAKMADKAVLTCLANYADDDGYSYPSIDRVAGDTCADRKTVIRTMQRLLCAGHIIDTGRRCGSTLQVPVYRFCGLPRVSSVHYTYRLTDPDTGRYYVGKRSYLGAIEADPYRGSGRWPTAMRESGAFLAREIVSVFQTAEESAADEQRLLRDAGDDPLCMNLELPTRLRRLQLAARAHAGGDFHGKASALEPLPWETVPFFRANSPVFPCKQSQKRVTEPIKEPIKEPKEGSPSLSPTNGSSADPPANGRSLTLAERAPSPPGFDQFWREFPRKVGKEAAMKAWQHALLRATAFAIMAGLRRQVAAGALDNGRFTPHPATWLNQGRWDDDPMASANLAPDRARKRTGFDALQEIWRRDHPDATA